MNMSDVQEVTPIPAIIYTFLQNLKNFDDKHKELAGVYYILISTLLFGALAFSYRCYLDHTPPL